jgi:hypothetical protein
MITRLTIIPIAMLLVICASGFPQTNAEEFTILRDHLKLPAATPVKLVTANTLSSDSPFRIYIVIDEEKITPKRVEKNFARWVEEWNKTDGKTYGIIEIVNSLSQADIIISRCTPFTSRHSQWLDRSDRDRFGVIGNPKADPFAVSEMYTYFIQRKPDGLEIINRSRGPGGEYHESDGKELWVPLTRLIKQHSKTKGK